MREAHHNFLPTIGRAPPPAPFGLAAGSLELTARRAALPAPVPVLMVHVQLYYHLLMHHGSPINPDTADFLCAN